LLQLIIFHFNETGIAPASQAAMFQTFIDSNVESAKRTLAVADHSKEEIYKSCEDISAAMFARPQGGLEIGELELRDQLDLSNLSFVLRFLVSARIGRIAPVSGAFSFTHRRFNEYFLVRQLKSKRTAIPYDAIQTDARWRDALVLYAEIADDADAAALVRHAWAYAEQLKRLSLGNDRANFIFARNALRFIVEGFRNRPEIVSRYRDSINDLIQSKLSDKDADLIETKTVLEALGLLDNNRATGIILFALEEYSGWISEQAATAARYLPTINRRLARLIYDHCVNRSGFEGPFEAKRQTRILSLSSAFAEVVTLLRWYQFDFLKTWLCAVVAIGSIPFNPYLPLTASICAGFLISIVGTGLSAVLGVFLPRSSVPPSLRATYFARALLVFGLGMFFANSLTTVLARKPPTSGFGLLFHIPPNEVPGVAIAILLVMLIGAIPITKIFWEYETIEKFLGQIRMRFVLIIAIQVLVLISIMMTPDWVVELIKPYAKYFVISIGGLLAIGVVFVGVLGLKEHLADRATLREATRNFRPYRKEIARDFLRFSTQWGRMRYVDELERLTVQHFETLKLDDNTWPDGVRPQTSDLASTKLAQLDARWLGLD
jgi:hypothetical protein